MPRIVLREIETERTLVAQEAKAQIGRDPACALVVEGTKSRVVSGRHATIFLQDGSWWIQDSSRNGTVVDDERLQPGQRHALRIGQTIGLGESGPRYRVEELDWRNAAATVTERPTPTRKGETRKKEESTEPSKPSPDWMVHVQLRATNTNQRHNVKALAVKIGRSPESHVQVPPELGASVSRSHAELIVSDTGIVLRDTNSRNGTYVNGQKLEGSHHALKGDLITLGSGGPTYLIEDLHIVKGQPTPAAPGASRAGTPIAEPPTVPAKPAR